MTKYNLLDITFLIPTRIDSIDRLQNILYVTNYLLEYFNTNIIVFEADSVNNHILEKLLNGKIKYVYYKDYDPIFFRTKYINKIVNMANTEIVAIWDTDVLAPRKQIIDAANLLRSDSYDFVYPYKYNLLNVPRVIINTFDKKIFMKTLEQYSKCFYGMYAPFSVGGAFLAKKKQYQDAGLENEKFYGWGQEDGERYERWSKLKYRIFHIVGNLYHLDHSRGLNSRYHSTDQQIIKSIELNRIKSFSEKDLISEITQWSNCRF